MSTISLTNNHKHVLLILNSQPVQTRVKRTKGRSSLEIHFKFLQINRKRQMIIDFSYSKIPVINTGYHMCCIIWPRIESIDTTNLHWLFSRNHLKFFSVSFPLSSQTQIRKYKIKKKHNLGQEIKGIWCLECKITFN